MDNPNVYLAVPCYGGIEPETCASVIRASTSGMNVSLNMYGSSLLACTFNRHWVQAWNQPKRPDYWCLHHADLGADQNNWLSLMIADMEANKLDVLSVVVPIKDGRGLTSTGVQDKATGQIRRLTMHELHGLPETFGIREAMGMEAHRYDLMINTGLMLVDFRKPWVKNFPGFEINDRIIDMPDGTKRANVLPEDWNFSGWAARNGLRVGATRKISVIHKGQFGFKNDTVWGSEKIDPGDNPVAEPVKDNLLQRPQPVSDTTTPQPIEHNRIKELVGK